MTTADWIAFSMKIGGFFVAIIAFVFGFRSLVLDLRSSTERVEKQVSMIETKVDDIQQTLQDIQIKAAIHDERAERLGGFVESIDKRVTYIERGRAVPS